MKLQKSYHINASTRTSAKNAKIFNDYYPFFVSELAFLILEDIVRMLGNKFNAACALDDSVT